jgi:hypothetical protein
MNKKLTTKELFAELIERLENKEIFLHLSSHDDKSLLLTETISAPTNEIKIGEVCINYVHPFRKE